jgi:hypothetical protein
MSHGLDFLSGKMWAAEQLKSIAARYLSRSAGMLAQKVVQSIRGGDPPRTRITAMKLNPSMTGGRDKLDIPTKRCWAARPSTSQEIPFQSSLTRDNIVPAAAGMIDPSRIKRENIFANDPRGWDRLQ